MGQLDIARIGIRKAGNAGLVTTTGGNDLLHTIPVTAQNGVTFSFPFIIRKVMWSNNTGANATLQFGTLSGVPAFVALLPTVFALNGFDGELGEAMLPAVEFLSTTAVPVAAVQRNGNAYVLCSAIGVLVAIEVEEFRA